MKEEDLMTSDTIVGNKLIAAFVGGVPYGDGSTHFLMPTQFKNKIVNATYLHKVDTFLYHLSWDQLMPVWKRIKDSKPVPGIFGMMDREEKEREIRLGLNRCDITFTWKAIVKFIYWYTKSWERIDASNADYEGKTLKKTDL